MDPKQKKLWFKYGNNEHAISADSMKQLWILLRQQMFRWLNENSFQDPSFTVSLNKTDLEDVKNSVSECITDEGYNVEMFSENAEMPSFVMLATDTATGQTKHIFQVYWSRSDKSYQIIFSPLGRSVQHPCEPDGDRKNYSYTTFAPQRNGYKKIPDCLKNLDEWVQRCVEGESKDFVKIFSNMDSCEVLWKYAGDSVERAGYSSLVQEDTNHAMGMVEARKEGTLRGKFLVEWVNPGGRTHTYFKITFKPHEVIAATRCFACGRTVLSCV